MEWDDAQLIKKYRNGERAAFEQLVRKYQRPLFTFLLRLVGHRETAEDLFQETFVKVVQALPNYDERGKFSGWMFGIANNLAIDTLRRKRLQKKHFSEEEDALIFVADAAPGPALELERSELREVLDALLQNLSDKQRQVFLLRQHAELSFKEIAEQMGEPLNTVLSHMHYAVKKLRRGFRSADFPRLAGQTKQVRGPRYKS